MKRFSVAFLLLTLSAAMPIPASAQRTHSVTLSDLQGLGFPDVTLQLSPDGRTLAYALSDDSLWLVNTPPRSAPRQIGKGFLPVWSPRGRRLAYYSVGSEGIQLWIFNRKTNRAVQITHVKGGINPDPTTRVVGWEHDAFRYSWSPNGARIVFGTRVPATGPGAAAPGGETTAQAPSSTPGSPLVLTDTTPSDWTLSGIFAHAFGTIGSIESKDGHSITAMKNANPGAVLTNQLFLADTRSERVTRLTRDDFAYFNPAWSPDGKAILCAGRGRPGPVFGVKAINLYTIDVATGRSRALATGPGIRSRPSWSPDGRQIAYLRKETFFTQQSVLVRPVGSGQTVNVTAKLNRDIEDYVWAGDGKSVLVTYKDGVSSPLARIALPSEKAERLAPTSDAASPLAVAGITASRWGAVAWKQTDPRHPGTLEYVAAEGHTAELLVDLYPQVRQWRLGEAEVVRWKNSHGVELEGTLLKPVDYQPGHRYPLIVDAYPLVGGADWFFPMMGNQAWASEGYAVFLPSPPAPHVWVNSWKSPESSLVGKGPQGWDVTVDDVMSGVDAVIRRGIADPNRMCLYGFSNGGGVVNDLVTRTGRFQCAVSVAGVWPDWLLPIFLEDVTSIRVWAGDITPWGDPAGYAKLSAVFHLDKVTTPMLLADGDNDGDFLLGTIEMYNGLRFLHRPVTFLRYPGQGHGFSGAAMKDFWKRENAYFAKYLGP